MTLSNSEGLAGCDLLRGLVFWETPNGEIESRLAAVSEAPTDFQELARDLTGLTVPDEIARALFSALADHVKDLGKVLKRPVGIRTAALDLLDCLESRLRGEGIVQEPPHENLVRMAFVDYLTGLPNFRSLSERFANEIKRATRYRRLLFPDHVRCGWFQGDQRPFRPSGGKRRFEACGWHTAALRQGNRRGGALRWRRIHGPVARNPQAHSRGTGGEHSGVEKLTIDPDNPDSVYDGFDGRNSVLSVLQ